MKITQSLILGTTLLGLSIAAQATPMLVNGGFETGDLSGWTQITSLGQNGCDSDWYVQIGDTQCNNVVDPTANPNLGLASQGQYAVFNSFDGAGPKHYTIEQDVMLGDVYSATLGFDYTVGWDFSVGAPATEQRIFSLSFLDSADSLIAEIFRIEIGPDDGISSKIGWTSEAFDVTSMLSGYSNQTVTLVADVFIPQAFTGPASMGLDAVNLDVVTSTVSASASGTISLLMMGIIGMSATRRGR